MSAKFTLARVATIAAIGASAALMGAAVATAAPATQFPGTGHYLVGVDIAPGTYVSQGGDDCYWERQSGLSGDFDDIIANDFVIGSGRVYVTIAPSDVAFESQWCGTWTQIQPAAAPRPATGSFGS